MVRPNPSTSSSARDARPGDGSALAPALTLVPLDPDRPARPDDDWSACICTVADRRDGEAFGRLFSHFAPRVKRYLMQCGSPEIQAEELTQEALVAVWRKAAMFDPAQAAASTWIFTIARNLRVDLLRRRHGLDSDGEDFDFDTLDSGEPLAEERLHAARQTERLRGALAQLSVEQQQVLRLSYFDDEPHSRIATELGIPLGTVKSRVRLAVAQLRRLLDR